MTVKTQRVLSLDRAVDDVEADLVPFAQDEGGAPQRAPDPAQHADLVGPAERIVEDVARDDLEDEAQEHRQQQQRGRYSPRAGAASAPRPVHRAISSIIASPRDFAGAVAEPATSTGRLAAIAYLIALMLLERALRPFVAVLVEVLLLREGAEGVLVGRVDLLAFLLEELDRLLLLRVVLRRARVERLVGLGAQLGLLRGLQARPRPSSRPPACRSR